jgi:hypothetical protein
MAAYDMVAWVRMAEMAFDLLAAGHLSCTFPGPWVGFALALAFAGIPLMAILG